MRDFPVSDITEAVARLSVEATAALPADLEASIASASQREENALGRSISATCVKTCRAARELGLPVCQDTGMAVVFAEIGQEVHFTGGSFEEAVNEGVHLGYTEGLLRCSVAADPIRRGNTGDNTPAVIHTRLVPGRSRFPHRGPQGFGSENMSRLQMMTPAATEDDLIAFVAETVRLAGGNPCPPVVQGVGIGGDFEQCALLAKRRCAALFPSGTRIRSTPNWKKKCCAPSMRRAWARRASAAIPRPLLSILNGRPHTLPAFPLR